MRLYLPLLINAQPEVRRQVFIILRSAYGERAVTYLRQLLLDGDPQVRMQARQALQTFGEFDALELDAGPTQGIVVECLGVLRVWIKGRLLQPSDWAALDSGRAGWQKLQSAFAYLVHCGRRGASRQALGEAVWGGSSSPSSLPRTLSSLRQLLSSVGGEEFAQRALVLTDAHCMLDAHSVTTDAQMFERTYGLAVEMEEAEGLDAAAPLYAQAVDLYGGPYMADLARGSGWMQERRDLLASHFINAVERLAEEAFEHGRYHQCAALCVEAIETDPASDEVTVWLLRAYASMGYRAELEQAYRRYLRVARVDPESSADHQDMVIRAYQKVMGARALGE